jgi:hypothetical protein
MSLQATDFSSGDKVLYLGIPAPAVVREIAARLTGGILVAIGDADEVRTSRREFCDLLNVMFVPGTPDEIPWQDGFFSRVIDTRDGNWPDPAKVAAEIARVTARARSV